MAAHQPHSTHTHTHTHGDFYIFGINDGLICGINFKDGSAHCFNIISASGPVLHYWSGKTIRDGSVYTIKP